MKKMFLVLFSMLLITVPQKYPAAAQIPTGLLFKIPQGIKPKLLYEYNNMNTSKHRFIFQGDSANNWTESLEIVSGMITGFQPNTPSMLYLSKINEMKKRCSGAKQFLISSTWNSITYEIIIKNCPTMPDQYCVSKIIYTNMAFYTITYTNRTQNMTQKTRDEWRKTVSYAILSQ